MKRDRELKELLKIVLEEILEYGCEFGMCGIVVELRECRIISGIEKAKLDYWISQLPLVDDWLFPKGQAEPRINFLKQEIEKL